MTAQIAKKKLKAKGRWQREAKAILALALAGFLLTCLASYDPSLHQADQASPVGPVGAWLGWILFSLLGYASYLFPATLLFYGVSGFIRPKTATGWPALVGVILLLVSATGLLARASDTLQEVRIHKGGLVGTGVVSLLSWSIGDVGSFLVLITSIPLGLLLLTQVSYAALWRSNAARVRGWFRKKKPAVSEEPVPGEQLPLITQPEREAFMPPRPPAIGGPKPRSSL